MKRTTSPEPGKGAIGSVSCCRSILIRTCWELISVCVFQYDSKQDEDEEEEAPSPMARDLDALSKMSNLRADESDEKPSIRAENKAQDVDANIHSTPLYNSLLMLSFHVIG